MFCYLVTNLCLTSATPWTVACQAPLSMRFPRQEYWSGLTFPSAGDLPNQGLNLHLLHWEVDSLPLSHQLSPYCALGQVYCVQPLWDFFFFNYCLLALLFLHLDFSFLEKKKDCTLWSTDGNLFLKRSQNSIGGKGWSSESLVQFNPRWQLICVFWFKVQ